MPRSGNKTCVTCGSPATDHHSHECPLLKRGDAPENYFTRMTRLRHEGKPQHQGNNDDITKPQGSI